MPIAGEQLACSRRTGNYESPKASLTSAVAHIDALQIEYSPWFVDHETDGLIDAAKELGVSIIAYSPLGKGMLTGTYVSYLIMRLSL
jgi:aryl-alcohol dehydrogenase-like predicted oxidoreductase